MIQKHGEENGKEIWEQYCKKQSITNTYEYKKEKYGWSKEQFKEYNKSRSVTIENLVKKYGEEIGLEKWNNYIERQRYTCSSEYFIEKYGKAKGQEKFDKFITNRENFWGYSNISQELFNNIKTKLNKNYTYFYAEHNSEFNINGYLLDFYISELNIAIEFNGDIWHANPKIYEENDIANPFSKAISKDIWKKDEKRINFLKTKIKDVIIVWEKDLKEKGMNIIVEELIEKIKTYE